MGIDQKNNVSSGLRLDKPGEPWSRVNASTNWEEPVEMVWAPYKDAPWLDPARALSTTLNEHRPRDRPKSRWSNSCLRNIWRSFCSSSNLLRIDWPSRLVATVTSNTSFEIRNSCISSNFGILNQVCAEPSPLAPSLHCFKHLILCSWIMHKQAQGN